MISQQLQKPGNYKFLKSAFALEGKFKKTEEVMQWLAERNKQVAVSINKIPFDQMSNWAFDEKNQNLRHDSGRFFSIDGIKIKTNWGSVPEWEQPIINQPEIGYLGFITKEFDGLLYFLLQAKIEPGNVNYVQLSPTLQATRSNYTQIHKGKKPMYLEYFQNAKPHEILLDQLQSEQGARFLKKRNRNIIIQPDEEIPVHEDFVWLTLGQLKQLMRHDNLVNMDTRTVVSGIHYGDFSAETIDLFNYLIPEKQDNQFTRAFLKSSLDRANALHEIEEIITFLTQLKSVYDLDVTKVDVRKLNDWVVEDSQIRHTENKYFRIIAVDVEIGNREVVKWSQPMVEPAQEGLCAFVCKEINGILHFAVQAKLECGNHDIIEFAPTVQCLTGNYQHSTNGKLPFLDYVLSAPKDQVYLDVHQSEEGGRFYREQNRNLIVVAGDEISDVLPERFIWMTLNQLQTFLKFNNYLNIQARSLISAISFT